MLNARIETEVNPPGPRGMPFIGATLRFRRDPLGFLTRCAEEFGDVFQIPLFRYALTPMEPKSRCYVINHPEMIRHVCVTQKYKYEPHRHLVDRLKKVLGIDDGELLTSTGSQWQERKALLQPSFSKDNISRIHFSADRTVRRSISTWSGSQCGSSIDVADAMLQMVTDVVAMTFAGVDFNGADKALRTAWVEALDGLSLQLAAPCLFVAKFRAQKDRKFQNALRQIERRIAQAIVMRQTEPGHWPDLLGAWIDSMDRACKPLSTKALRDQLFLMLIAGRRNVANALTWSLYLLGKNPDVALRLYEEACRVPTDDLLTLKCLDRLHYTRMVQQEVLRLYPPAWLIARRCIEDDEVAGYSIPQGATVFMSPYLLHRHPAYWEDPERFQPERFADSTKVGRDTYLPFGKGPRTCIGNHFTSYLMQLALFHLSRKFTFHTQTDRHVTVKASSSLHPCGLTTTLRPRHEEIST